MKIEHGVCFPLGAGAAVRRDRLPSSLWELWAIDPGQAALGSSGFDIQPARCNKRQSGPQRA